jgi:polyphosphate kinase
MSPHQMKSSLLDMIKKEREKKDDGRIIAKMNALVDTDIIKALYLFAV